MSVGIISNSFGPEDCGKTSEPTWTWSGDTLLDLDRHQALKVPVRKVGDADYLVVESGGSAHDTSPTG